MRHGELQACDPYPELEQRLRLTRRCLEVLEGMRHPVYVITRSHLVTRDADILRSLARADRACVLLSLGTLDARVADEFEPGAPLPLQRLHAIHQLANAAVPVGIHVAPVIPGVNCHELPALLDAAAAAGAQFATCEVLDSRVQSADRPEVVIDRFRLARVRAGLSREVPRLAARRRTQAARHLPNLTRQLSLF